MQHFVKLLKYSRCLYADRLAIYIYTIPYYTVSALKYMYMNLCVYKKMFFLFYLPNELNTADARLIYALKPNAENEPRNAKSKKNGAKC